MAPQKTIPSPSVMYAPPTPVDPDHEARLKAEARAYALSGGKNGSSGTKRKLPVSSAVKKTQTKKVSKPTSLNIHRPEKQRKTAPKHSKAETVIPPTAKSIPAPKTGFDGEDDDYSHFVRSLGLDETFFAALDNDDEDFHLSDAEDDDDDDEDDNDTDIETQNETTDNNNGKKIRNADESAPQRNSQIDSTPSLSSPLYSSPPALPDFERDMFRELEEELGNLLEEDLEAAVQSLMTSKKPSSPKVAKGNASNPKTSKTAVKKQQSKAGKDDKEKSSGTDTPTTPLRDAARQGTSAQVTYQQSQQLRRLLTRHYQLLVQQSILAVRAAHKQKALTQKETKDKTEFLSGETADDLAEILDGAVGMLQDLDQNRRDAIRNSIQLAEAKSSNAASMSGRRSLLSRFTESTEAEIQPKDRRLTRAAFFRTLQQQGGRGTKRTAFDIPGLVKLNETFASIDKSVDGVPGSILGSSTHTEACKMVLRQAGAHVEESFVPGTKDLSENFCDCREFFGEDFQSPCTDEQELSLRKNRNLFTSGEDNLVLRGVNLYGEKQWILIADRYLPDRSVNIISQRYSKLCVMLYKAHGICIDEKGNLTPPPKLESVDDIDDSQVQRLGLKKVEPPAILNVHRWSLEEDLTLLKAVPIMGHMWAELGARLIPHRDRGHLRKRYQVLERRVKATITRNAKNDLSLLKSSRWNGPPRKVATAAVALKSPIEKSGRNLGSGACTKKMPARKLPVTSMSIEKAAASLAGLRPDILTAPLAPQATTSTSTNNVVSKRPGKEVPTAKPTVLPRKASGGRRPSPKLPVAKSITSTQAPTMELSEPFDTNTRSAFEKLVEGTSEEWSQMSRMKKMLENEDESQAADAIASQLAKSPVSNISKLPNLQLDTNSMSGLSMLQSEVSRNTFPENEIVKPPSRSKTSILSRVLENSKSCDFNPRKKEQSNEVVEKKVESAYQRPEKNNSLLLPPHPLTPKRNTFFSISSNPTGFSPSFHSSPSARSNIAIPLMPNPVYSPAPSSVLRYVGEEPSIDAMKFCDFQISEESRRELEGGQKGNQHDPTPPPLTPSKNSLLFEDDLDAMEAISALNSLSNSPFHTKKTGDEEAKNEGRSLFAAVVGNCSDHDAKEY